VEKRIAKTVERLHHLASREGARYVRASQEGVARRDSALREATRGSKPAAAAK
jgi:hypothetical protein